MILMKKLIITWRKVNNYEIKVLKIKVKMSEEDNHRMN